MHALAVRVGLLLVATSLAHASPSVRVEVLGDCDVGPALAEARALLGDDHFSGDAPRVLRIVTAGEPPAARVTIVDAGGAASGPRVLAAPDCAALQAPLAVVISTLVRTLPPPPPTRPPPPSDLVESELAIVRSPAPVPEVTTALVGGAASMRSSHGFTAEVSAGLRLAGARRSLDVVVRHRGADRVALQNVGGEVRTAHTSIDLVPCLGTRVAACVIASLGWLDTDASGLADVRPAWLTVVTAGGRARAEVGRWGGLALEARLDVRAPLIGARLLVDEMPVWSSSRYEVAVGIDAVARIP